MSCILQLLWDPQGKGNGSLLIGSINWQLMGARKITVNLYNNLLKMFLSASLFEFNPSMSIIIQSIDCYVEKYGSSLATNNKLSHTYVIQENN